MKKKILDILYNPSSMCSVSYDPELSVGEGRVALQQFHVFLCHLTKSHVGSLLLFQECCEIFNDLKRLIEHKDGLIHESLWVELEKCAYVLSLWESSQFSKDISRFH